MGINRSLLMLFRVLLAVCLVACNGNKASETKNLRADSSVTASDSTSNAGQLTGIPNFVSASKSAMSAVVHIQVLLRSTAVPGDAYGLPMARRTAASGSGVIISTDGYIATNNHVVEAAAEISVVLPDKRRFTAKLVGRDPNTDLALIKIDASGLPAIAIGNSDKVQIGQWVLAVGFPLSLNTTVTAGIVSAKARSIGIINSKQNSMTGASGNAAVESFIQTDAAINPGNSGGALVNTSGELVGINTAIASPTGSYSGYAFAIPANLAKKILDDLRQYGTVKRGVLGVSFPSPSAEDRYFLQHGQDPATLKGVYITGVQPASAASEAGLQEGDVIQSINGIELNSSTEFSERIARHKPGDELRLTYVRQGKVTEVTVRLKDDKTSATVNQTSSRQLFDRLGAGFAILPAQLKQQMGLASGVLVTTVQQGGFFYHVGIPPGTIIVFINGQPVSTPKEVGAALHAVKNGLVQIFAIAPDGSKVAFNFSIGT